MQVPCHSVPCHAVPCLSRSVQGQARALCGGSRSLQMGWGVFSSSRKMFSCSLGCWRARLRLRLRVRQRVQQPWIRSGVMQLRTGWCQVSPALRRCSAELLPDAFGFRSPAYGNNVLLSLFIAHFSFLTRFIIIFKACVAQSKSLTSRWTWASPVLGLEILPALFFIVNDRRMERLDGTRRRPSPPAPAHPHAPAAPGASPSLRPPSPGPASAMASRGGGCAL